MPTSETSQGPSAQAQEALSGLDRQRPRPIAVPELYAAPLSVRKTLRFLEEQELGAGREGANRRSEKEGAGSLPLPSFSLSCYSLAPLFRRPLAPRSQSSADGFALPGDREPARLSSAVLRVCLSSPRRRRGTPRPWGHCPRIIFVVANAVRPGGAPWPARWVPTRTRRWVRVDAPFPRRRGAPPRPRAYPRLYGGSLNEVPYVCGCPARRGPARLPG